MFNNIGPLGLILIVVVVLLLFGRGKIASVMGEFGKGITSFKKGMNDAKTELDEAEVQTAEKARDVTPEKKS